MNAVKSVLYPYRYYLFLGVNAAFFARYSQGGNVANLPSDTYGFLKSIGLIYDKKMYL